METGGVGGLPPSVARACSVFFRDVLPSAYLPIASAYAAKDIRLNERVCARNGR